MYVTNQSSGPPTPEPSKIRKGRFLWMDREPQKEFVDTLKQKISDGFFTSDQVLNCIVDEMAPVLNDAVNR
jgi:hypothetical protein